MLVGQDLKDVEPGLDSFGNVPLWREKVKSGFRVTSGILWFLETVRACFGQGNQQVPVGFRFPFVSTAHLATSSIWSEDSREPRR